MAQMAQMAKSFPAESYAPTGRNPVLALNVPKHLLICVICVICG